MSIREFRVFRRVRWGGDIIEGIEEEVNFEVDFEGVVK